MTRSEVRAPFDAIISEVEVAAGIVYRSGQMLISLFPVNNLEIRAHLPINYINRYSERSPMVRNSMPA